MIIDDTVAGKVQNKQIFPFPVLEELFDGYPSTVPWLIDLELYINGEDSGEYSQSDLADCYDLSSTNVFREIATRC